MSGPDRIWAWPRLEWVTDSGTWSDSDLPRSSEYIRRDRAVLAALPEVQALIAGAFDAAAKLALPGERGSQVDPTEFVAGCRHNGLRLNAAIRAMTPADALAARDAMIAEAVAKERARIIAALREEADVLPCREDAKVTEGCADLIEADFSYDDEAERIAAIRKRGEGQP